MVGISTASHSGTSGHTHIGCGLVAHLRRNLGQWSTLGYGAISTRGHGIVGVSSINSLLTVFSGTTFSTNTTFGPCDFFFLTTTQTRTLGTFIGWYCGITKTSLALNETARTTCTGLEHLRWAASLHVHITRLSPRHKKDSTHKKEKGQSGESW
jgi:hypothetical protein